MRGAQARPSETGGATFRAVPEELAEGDRSGSVPYYRSGSVPYYALNSAEK